MLRPETRYLAPTGRRPLSDNLKEARHGLLPRVAVMILGMSTATFTLLHVIISLVAIAAGLVVLAAMLLGRNSKAWTALFLATTILTSVTGFFFHSVQIGPPHVVGVISLVVLALVLLALYTYHLAGRWRWVYVTGAVLALYLNVFVAVVQTFQKVAFFNALAPTQTEPPFLVAQALVLGLFVVLGFVALRKFHPAAKIL
jgi:hypothetical protein